MCLERTGWNEGVILGANSASMFSCRPPLDSFPFPDAQYGTACCGRTVPWSSPLCLRARVTLVASRRVAEVQNKRLFGGLALLGLTGYVVRELPPTYRPGGKSWSRFDPRRRENIGFGGPVFVPVFVIAGGIISSKP